jgi:putative SOS response-associated peptidase YedK
MRWGFVSPTTKEPKHAPINARAETLPTSPMFRDAFRRHRCLVVADGFYEWRKTTDVDRSSSGTQVGRPENEISPFAPHQSDRGGRHP